MSIRYAFLAGIILLAGCGSSPTTSPPPQHIAARSNLVAFMGDSITQFWAPYMPVQAKFTTINFGISGQTSTQMLARFQSEVIDASPEVGIVVIDAGINDFQLDYAGDPVTTDSVATMAHMAQQAGIRVIIASIMLADYLPGGYVVPTRAQVNAFNAQLIALCKANGYLYADFFTAMLLPDGTENFALYLDGVHPTQAGYAAMWPVVLALINETL